MIPCTSSVPLKRIKQKSAGGNDDQCALLPSEGSASPKEIFEFNPLADPNDFLDWVVKKAYKGGNFSELQCKRDKVAAFSTITDESKKAKLAEKKKELLIVAGELKENIKFIFPANIDKHPIPIALVTRHSDIIKNSVSALFAKEYLLCQIYGLFKTTDCDFSRLCDKGRLGRNEDENDTYDGVIELLGAVYAFKKLAIKSTPEAKKEQVAAAAALDKIKKMGPEGAQMYHLLSHLIEPSEACYPSNCCLLKK